MANMSGAERRQHDKGLALGDVDAGNAKDGASVNENDSEDTQEYRKYRCVSSSPDEYRRNFWVNTPPLTLLHPALPLGPAFVALCPARRAS